MPNRKNRRSSSRTTTQLRRKAAQRRALRLETLEDRRLLAVVGSQDFDGGETGLIAGFDPVSDNLDGGPGDFFGVGSRNAWPQGFPSPGVPFSLGDDTVVNYSGGGLSGSDDEGVFGQNSDFDNDYFAISDSDEFGAGQIASWSFNIQHYNNLKLSVDLAGISDADFGGYSAGSGGEFTAQIDGGPVQSALSLEAVVAAFTTRPMDDGDPSGGGRVLEASGDNPVTKFAVDTGLAVGDTYLDKSPASGSGAGGLDTFSTAITGTGSVLTLTFIADMPFEAFAFDNILIEGDSTGPDTTAPDIFAIDPADDATGVLVGTDLEITFNEDVVVGSGDITIGAQVIDVTGPNVAVSGNVVTIDPPVDLDPGASYSVFIDPTAFDDLAGNSFAGIGAPTAWNFETEVADLPPVFVATGPFQVSDEAFAGTVVGDVDADNDGQIDGGVTYEITSISAADSMAVGVNGFDVKPIFTVGETLEGTTGDLNSTTAGDYTPPGILDGLGAYELDDDTVRVFANHELLNFRGYDYEVSDGAGGSFTLDGARISYFDIDKDSHAIVDGGLAYNTIYDANGNIATDNSFLANNFVGFSRFCSGQLFEAHQFGGGRGLEDRIYFAGEEDGGFFNSVGGGEWALDPETGNLWHVPAMGRGAWENITELDTGTTDHVAFLLADDSSPFDFDPANSNGDEAAPLFLYVGEKDHHGDFLEQNGLRDGKLYVWVPDDLSKQTPADFNTSGTLAGSWLEVDNTPQPGNGSENGSTGFDEFGFPTQGNLWLQARDLGAFGFSRPEDVSTNPSDGTEAVLASTGVDTFVGGADTFGTLYTVNTDFSSINSPTATLTILYDGDADTTRALRSPDNLDWADDGFIYVQEDEAEEDTLGGEPLFGPGAVNPNEAGIVRIDPVSAATLRVANVDRSVILDASIAQPLDAVDKDAGDAGEWETSGILDVSTLFDEAPGTMFIFDVQAHGIEDQGGFNPSSRLNDNDLVEGGQLSLLWKSGVKTDLPAMAFGVNGYQVDPVFTVGETIPATTGDLNSTTAGDYTPPGILDGLGAYELNDETVRVFGNHELLSFRGYDYEVNDGQGGTFTLDGARISYFDIDKEHRTIVDAGIAYNTIYDANGNVATDNSFLANDLIGFSRFCSGQLFEPEQFGSGRGLEDRIYFAGEEDGGFFNGVGGGEWALDPETGSLWHVPAMGRGAWENITEIDTGTKDHVAFILADDTSPFDFDDDGEDEAAPLFLYVGEKDKHGDFLARNGLRDGKLFVWVSDSGETDPTQFNGLPSTPDSLQGSWVQIDNSPTGAPSEDGSTGFDEYGYPTQGTLWLRAKAARSADATVGLMPIGTYATGVFDEAAAEISAYDPATQRVFFTNADADEIGVLDISDPTNPSPLSPIDVSGVGSPNSVAVANGIVAVAVAAAVDTDPGSVLFYDANGALLNSVSVGVLPDMLTFTPDGQKVLVANEGEPDGAIDPEGSISIIDLSNGVAAATVKTADFTKFNNKVTKLVNDGVRLFPDVLDGTITVAQDLEPEYIAVSPDGKEAFVTLQEANAFAVVNIKKAKVKKIVPLGTKDHSLPGNGLDPSDRDPQGAPEININNWPVHGLYMPDAVTSFEVNGKTFYITANEGDDRGDADEDARGDAIRLKDIDDVTSFGRTGLSLDPSLDPALADDDQLGRLNISSIDGDLDGDGDLDQLFSYGARSFTIWNDKGEIVFDSGDQLEQITAAAFPDNFNANNDENDPEGRSDNKGPEPEAVTTGVVAGRTLAFVGLERIGGIVVYDVSDPTAPVFQQYLNNRDFSEDPETGNPGDLGVEDLKFIPAEDSPTGVPLLVAANEVSGTVTIFKIGHGAFGFSRPEDVSTNPNDGTEIILASTGVDTFVGGADTFGTLYKVKTNFSDISNPTGTLEILYDGDADPTRGLRSPDNLDWADDGFIYVQEDEAEEDTLGGEPLFGPGAVNPNEAGIVRVNPNTGVVRRVANIDRNVILDASIANPADAVDVDAGDAGEWESSGILDVSTLFDEAPGTLFLFDVQAHGIEDQSGFNPGSRINDNDLVEGGQLAFLEKAPFEINPNTGVITVANANVLDADEVSAYRLTVEVSDGVNPPVETPVNISVNDDDVMPSVDVRFATYNASLNRNTQGELIDDLSTLTDSQAQDIAAVIQLNNPDVLLVNEFDFDNSEIAANLFRQNYLEVPQALPAGGTTDPVYYPYVYLAPSNTGVASGFDLDNSGGVGGPGDAYGFGFFEGQFAMVVFSKYEIDELGTRTFQEFLWKDMPGALLPEDPLDADGNSNTDNWYTPDELDVVRLSSKSHWDVPIDFNGSTIHALVSHPTPPVFDGPEDRNGTRNYDEIRFWADYVTPGAGSYIYDDAGVTSGLAEGARFVIMGDQNADPFDGDSVPGAIDQLLTSPNVNTSLTPSSLGGVENADPGHVGDPAFDTSDFGPVPGNLRVDYVLPSNNLNIDDAAVYWPESADPNSPLVAASDHRLVWTDLTPLASAGVVNGTLIIVGTNDKDDIKLKDKKDGEVEVKIKSQGFDDLKERFSGVDLIVIYGLDGDDKIKVEKKVEIDAMLFGGAGKDKLKGGGGLNLLDGGAGDDRLKGGNLGDILIGGTGEDKLEGRRGNDLLIGGELLDDLNQVFADWRDGSLNLLALTIDDDDEEDELEGDQGADVFFDGLDDLFQDFDAGEGDQVI